MPGLMPQAQAPMQPQAPTPPGPQQGADQQDAGGDQDYKRFMGNVLSVLYNDKTTPMIVDRLKKSQDPVSDLAQITVQAVVRVEDSAEQNGVTPQPESMLRAGAEAVADIAQLSSDMGGHEFSEEEIQVAFLRAVDLYRATRQGQGKIDPKSAQAELAQMQQDDQSGALEQQFPGMKEAVARMAGQGGPQQPAPSQVGDASEQNNGIPMEPQRSGPVPKGGADRTSSAPKKVQNPSSGPGGAFKRKGMRQAAKKKQGRG